MTTSSVVSLPTINSSSRIIKSAADSSTHDEAYRSFSYSNLDPPFGLDFTRDRSDIFLGQVNSDFDIDEDDETYSPTSPSTTLRGSSESISVITGYIKDELYCFLLLIKTIF